MSSFILLLIGIAFLMLGNFMRTNDEIRRINERNSRRNEEEE